MGPAPCCPRDGVFSWGGWRANQNQCKMGQSPCDTISRPCYENLTVQRAGFEPSLTHQGIIAEVAGNFSHKPQRTCNLGIIPPPISLNLTGVIDTTGIPVAVRDRFTFRASTVFAIAALVGLSNPPAGYSQPDVSEVWCKTHNSDASAVSRCIEAEKGSGPPTRRATETHLRPGPLSGDLPLPRPRPQAAPQPTPEYVQATDKLWQSAPVPSLMRSDQAGPSDARLEE
jgi:hypothetical protein